MLTAERLRELLRYDPETGIFTRLSCPSRPSWIGKTVGSDRGKGWLSTRLDGAQYFMRDLAWLYMTGEWPTHTVDHENRVKADNRWANLREATHAQQAQNRKVYRTSKSGVPGVIRVPYGRQEPRWRTQIEIGGRALYLGFFEDFELAEFVRKEAERKYFTHTIHKE
jgi:hypothetical protein